MIKTGNEGYICSAYRDFVLINPNMTPALSSFMKQLEFKKMDTYEIIARSFTAFCNPEKSKLFVSNLQGILSEIRHVLRGRMNGDVV